MQWVSVLLFSSPIGSLSAMRFVAAVQEREKGGDKLVEQVSRELWRRIWSDDKDITEPASLSEVPTYTAWLLFEEINEHYSVLSQYFFVLQAALKAGLSDDEIKELLELSISKEIKDKLKSSTQDALDYGVSCPSFPPHVKLYFLFADREVGRRA